MQVAYVGLLAGLLAFVAPAAATPSDAELLSILKERVEQQRWATGVVMGITTPAGRRVLSYGKSSLGDAKPVGGDTVFEIASITKIFTSLLLADMAKRGEVTLHGPVAGCLKSGNVRLPTRGDRQISFIDLATHTSGLPLRPANLASQRGANKYAGYTTQQLYAGLADFTLARDIGSAFEYSNWGFGLLGNALAGCAKVEYATAVRDRITAPLGMVDTQWRLSTSMQSRATIGYDEQFKPTQHEQLGALSGSGGLLSTANDLLVFLDAFLGRKPSLLDPAMASMLDERRPTDDPYTVIGLGWRIDIGGPQQVVWSNGRSDGYRSFVGYDPQTRVGVVALANAATNTGLDDVARYALGSPQRPIRFHQRIELSTAILDRYTGKYVFDDGGTMTFLRDGNMLVSQMSGQGANPIYASSPTTFHPQDIEAQIEFDPPVEGRSPALTMQQDGVIYRAIRRE